MKRVLGLILCIALAVWTAPAFALPGLQLDIVDSDPGTPSWYNPAAGASGYNALYDGETIMSGGDIFTLYALMGVKNQTSLDDTYYISMALYPNPGTSAPPTDGYGSFTVDGTTFTVTDSMAWGTPASLAPHGVFATYYRELAFQFNPVNKVGKYNTQDNTGRFEAFAGGTGLYYNAFAIDTRALNHAVSIHFDLYSSSGAFAPFSHDAQSDPPPTGVAEPVTLLLLGLGLVGVAGIKRRIRS